MSESGYCAFLGVHFVESLLTAAAFGALGFLVARAIAGNKRIWNVLVATLVLVVTADTWNFVTGLGMMESPRMPVEYWILQGALYAMKVGVGVAIAFWLWRRGLTSYDVPNRTIPADAAKRSPRG